MHLAQSISMREQAEMLGAGSKIFQNEVHGRCLVRQNVTSLTEKSYPIPMAVQTAITTGPLPEKSHSLVAG